MLNIATNILVQGTLSVSENIPIIGPFLIAPSRAILKTTEAVALLAVTLFIGMTTLLTFSCYLANKTIQITWYLGSKAISLVYYTAVKGINFFSSNVN